MKKETKASIQVSKKKKPSTRARSDSSILFEVLLKTTVVSALIGLVVLLIWWIFIAMGSIAVGGWVFGLVSSSSVDIAVFHATPKYQAMFWTITSLAVLGEIIVIITVCKHFLRQHSPIKKPVLQRTH